MSPEPYVRWQALVVALLLAAAAVLGSPVAALVVSLAGAAGSWGLHARYRGDLAAAGVAVPPRDPPPGAPPRRVPPHRDRLDRIVAGDVRSAFAVGVTASALMVGFGIEPPRIGASPATPVLAAAAGLGVLLSSLFDWYVVLPRMSGLLGVRPCREPEGEHPRWPRTWRELTTWWLLHRMVVVVVLWYGLSYAIVLTLHRYTSLPGETTIVSGAALGALASYRKALGQVGMQVMHPTMIVGQTVRRRTSERAWRTATWRGRRMRLPWFRRRAVGPLGEREYVYDVAVEGVQVVPAAQREGAVRRDDRGAVVYERYPAKVELRDIGSCQRAEDAFSGCAGSCSGVSWYCIENPRCFAKK